MDKAFDINGLKEKVLARAKENGLTLAEETLEELIESVLEGTEAWLQASVDITPTPVDNLALSAFSFFKSRIQDQIRKIDLDGDGD